MIARRTLLAALGAATLLVAGCATTPPPSCDDLILIANGLDDVADYYVGAGAIYEGSRDDVLFGELVDELEELALIEHDGQLSTAVDAMAIGYDEFDGVAFEQGLEATTYRIDQLYDRDCR